MDRDPNDPVESYRRTLGELLAALRDAGADTSRPSSMKCPFHEDRVPSSGVYQDDQGVWRFKCQSTHCGFGGDVFDVRQRASGETIESQMAELRRLAKSSAKPKREPRRFGSIDEWRAAIPHCVAVYRYTNPESKAVELLKARVELPGERKHFLQAHVANGVVIESSPPPPHPIYNRTRVRDASQVVVVEGEKCVHALADIGVVATCCPGGGRKGSAKDADLSPLAGKTIILWPDHDAPNDQNERGGHLHMREVAAQLAELRPVPSIYWLDPDRLSLAEKEDVADYLAKFEPAGRADAISDALDLVVPIGGAGQDVEQWIEAIIDGRVANIATPYKGVNKLCRPLLPGTVVVLVGDPGAAKSMLINSLLIAWYHDRLPYAAYMLEDDRRFHLHRILAQIEGDSRLLDDEWVRENPEDSRAAYRRYAGVLDDIGARITDAPDDTLGYPAVLAWMEQKAKAGARVIIVDPITAVEAGKHPWESDKTFMASAKAILRKFGASLILVTHPRDGKNHGSLDQIAGSRAFPRFAQTVLWLKPLGGVKKFRVKELVAGIERFVEIDRQIVISKARNGRGQGLPLGFYFCGKSLSFIEQGVVLKEASDE